MTGDDGEHPPLGTDGEGLLPDRVIPVEDWAGSPDHGTLVMGPLEQLGPIPDGVLPDDIFKEDHLAGVGSHVPDGAPTPVNDPDPQHEVGEREVCEQLPVAHEQVDPLDGARVEFGVPSQLLGKGAGHGPELMPVAPAWEPRRDATWSGRRGRTRAHEGTQRAQGYRKGGDRRPVQSLDGGE